MAGLSALPAFILRKCCAMDEWQAWRSYTAAIGQGLNGRYGPLTAQKFKQSVLSQPTLLYRIQRTMCDSLTGHVAISRHTDCG